MNYIVKLQIVVKDEQMANEIAGDLSTAWNTLSLPGFLDPRITSWMVSTERSGEYPTAREGEAP